MNEAMAEKQKKSERKARKLEKKARRLEHKAKRLERKAKELESDLEADGVVASVPAAPPAPAAVRPRRAARSATAPTAGPEEQRLADERVAEDGDAAPADLGVREAIDARRSIKRFGERAVTRVEIETLLEAAAQAPNHRLTQPWRFYVLGPEARRAYGDVLGGRKAKKIEDPEAGRLVREKVADEHAALPAMIVFATVEAENPEIRQEDYAATMMAVENLCLAAVAMGLGTHIKTGAVMDDPGARAATGVAEGERIVAVVNVGEPAEVPSPKERRTAADLTTWVD
jgi:nitroreductase